MLEGWETNLFSDLNTQTPSSIPEAPGHLLFQRWQSPASVEDHKISTILGRLKERGYLFKYSEGWGNWPVDYLNDVLFHYYAIELLQSRWAAESQKKKVEANNQNHIATVYSPAVQAEKQKEAQAMASLYDIF